MEIVGADPPSTDQIRERHERLLGRLRLSAEANGHDPDRLRIVAVTKTWPVEIARAATVAGLTRLGESRVQEAEPKIEALPEAEWHFIGRLQSNKARLVDRLCELVHSVDSASSARRLTVPTLVEVNLSGEESKSGIPPEQLADFLAAHPARGLMTMPPAVDDPERSRPFFRRLRALAAEHGLPELSMGTSQDYRVAAEEGATLVRVGSVLYRG